MRRLRDARPYQTTAELLADMKAEAGNPGLKNRQPDEMRVVPRQLHLSRSLW